MRKADGNACQHHVQTPLRIRCDVLFEKATRFLGVEIRKINILVQPQFLLCRRAGCTSSCEFG